MNDQTEADFRDLEVHQELNTEWFAGQQDDREDWCWFPEERDEDE